MGGKGEGSGGKGGGNYEWGTPLSTPSRHQILVCRSKRLKSFFVVVEIIVILISLSFIPFIPNSEFYPL